MFDIQVNGYGGVSCWDMTDKDIGALAKINFNSVIGYGFQGDDGPTGVITVEDGKFPQDILLEFVQDKVSLLEDVKVGDDVQVTFDIRGREYNGRYFNNLQAWRLQKSGGAAGSSDNGTATGNRPPMPTEAPGNVEEIDADIDPF